MPVVEGQVPEIYLEPGESRLVRKPVILKTVLGSCIGGVFRVPKVGMGALCHPMLPDSRKRRTKELSRIDARRYVDSAIRELLGEFDRLGIARSDIQAKLFGGADVLGTGREAEHLAIGRLNREMAWQVLRDEGVTVLASSLGGHAGIHIQFHTGTGEVLLRRLHGLKAVIPATL